MVALPMFKKSSDPFDDDNALKMREVGYLLSRVKFVNPPSEERLKEELNHDAIGLLPEFAWVKGLPVVGQMLVFPALSRRYAPEFDFSDVADTAVIVKIVVVMQCAPHLGLWASLDPFWTDCIITVCYEDSTDMIGANCFSLADAPPRRVPF